MLYATELIVCVYIEGKKMVEHSYTTRKTTDCFDLEASYNVGMLQPS